MDVARSAIFEDFDAAQGGMAGRSGEHEPALVGEHVVGQPPPAFVGAFPPSTAGAGGADQRDLVILERQDEAL